MTLYQKLSKIFPYLKSIRVLDSSYTSIDVEFSKTWKAPKSIISNVQYVTNQSDNPQKSLLSFACVFNDKDSEYVLGVIEQIIDFNIELELKNNLLENKISELKNLFNKASLHDLESLEFKLKKEEESLEFKLKKEEESLVLPEMEDGYE